MWRQYIYFFDRGQLYERSDPQQIEKKRPLSQAQRLSGSYI